MRFFTVGRKAPRSVVWLELAFECEFELWWRVLGLMKGNTSWSLHHLPLVLAIVLLSAANAGCKQGPWTLWNSYSSRFIDAQGRVIDPQGGQRTTSEGQSYALFFALVNNDRNRFNQIFTWTQINLAGGNLGAHLPGWLWGKAPDGHWKLLDANSASDSDCWIAYSLLEAGRLWNEPTYTNVGRLMLGMIAKQEVADLPGFGSMLMPGPTALWVHKDVWTVNASYVPVFLLDRFAAVDPTGPWGAIEMNVPRFLRLSARKGFAMDWSDYAPSAGFAPSAGPAAFPADNGANKEAAKDQKAESEQAANALVPPAPKPAFGSYDAIRVYLWAGMVDGSGRTRADLLSAVPGMATYLANHGAPPEKVTADGMPQAQDGPVGFSAAVLPYLRALDGTDKLLAQQRLRLAGQLDNATGLYGKDPTYYDQNLALFANGFLDGRFRFGARGDLRVEWTKQ